MGQTLHFFANTRILKTPVMLLLIFSFLKWELPGLNSFQNPAEDGKSGSFFGLHSLHNSHHCDALEKHSPRMEALHQSSLDGIGL